MFQSYRLEVWDWEEDGSDRIIGEATVNANQLTSGLRI